MGSVSPKSAYFGVDLSANVRGAFVSRNTLPMSHTLRASSVPDGRMPAHASPELAIPGRWVMLKDAGRGID
ncbi:MAG: hypothetical protein ACREDR_28760 [Blastocatellia bacterium]